MYNEKSTHKEASVGSTVVLFIIILFVGIFGVLSIVRADYTVDTGGSSTSDSLQVTSFGNANAGCCNVKVAQQFTPTADGQITSINGQFYIANSPAGQIYATIETSDGGSPASPTGTIIGTSNSVTHSTGSYTSTTANNVTFGTPVSVFSGVDYFVVWHSSVAESGSNSFGIASLAATSPQARSYYSGSWNTSAGYQGRMSVTIASSTVASIGTTTIVDNPAQNVFNGVVLFLSFAWFAAWFFAKKR